MRLTRRALLTGEVTGTAHISSLVVHCRPEAVDELVGTIEALPEAQVPRYSDHGKLVVLLETASENTVMQRISTIENLPGVINAALVYHEIDTEAGNTP